MQLPDLTSKVSVSKLTCPEPSHNGILAARKAISEFNLGVRDGNIDKIDIPAYFIGTDIKVVKSVLDEASAHDGFNLNIWSKGDKLEVVKVGNF